MKNLIMNFNDFLSAIGRNWTIFSGLIVGVALISYTFSTMESQISNNNTTLSDVNIALHAYVDAKDKLTNTRIDDIQKDIQKMEIDQINSLSEIRNISKEIRQSQSEDMKETNQRFDNMVAVLVSNEKKSH